MSYVLSKAGQKEAQTYPQNRCKSFEKSIQAEFISSNFEKRSKYFSAVDRVRVLHFSLLLLPVNYSDI